MPRSRSATVVGSRRASRRCSLPCAASGDRYRRRAVANAGTAGEVVVGGHLGEPAVGPQQVGHRRAVHVVVLDADRPPGRSRAAASAITGRITARPSAPPNTASAGSWSATSGGTGGAVRDVRRVAEQHVDRAAQVGEQVRVGDVARDHLDGRRTRRRCGAARPGRPASAPPRSPGRPGLSSATASAIAPVPLHRSTTIGARRGVLDPPAGQQLGLRARARRRRRRPPARGAGTRPCRAGAATGPAGPAAATSSVNRRSSSARSVSISSSRPRGTPSTCAASSSASTRGDSTPGRGEFGGGGGQHRRQPGPIRGSRGVFVVAASTA